MGKPKLTGAEILRRLRLEHHKKTKQERELRRLDGEDVWIGDWVKRMWENLETGDTNSFRIKDVNEIVIELFKRAEDEKNYIHFKVNWNTIPEDLHYGFFQIVELLTQHCRKENLALFSYEDMIGALEHIPHNGRWLEVLIYDHTIQTEIPMLMRGIKKPKNGLVSKKKEKPVKIKIQEE